MSLHYSVPCEIWIRKLATIWKMYDKLQGSITKHLRCNVLFTTNLSLSLLVKELVKLMNIWQSYGQNGWLRHSLHSPCAFASTMQNSPRKGYPHKRQHSRWILSQELIGKILLATLFAKYTRVEMTSRKRQTYQNKAKNLCTVCVWLGRSMQIIKKKA